MTRTRKICSLQTKLASVFFFHVKHKKGKLSKNNSKHSRLFLFQRWLTRTILYNCVNHFVWCINCVNLLQLDNIQTYSIKQIGAKMINNNDDQTLYH